MDMPETPMHDKLKAVEAVKDTITPFVEWLVQGTQTSGYRVGEPISLACNCSIRADRDDDCDCDLDFYGTELMIEVSGDRVIKDLLAAYFGIDQRELEREKEALLAYVRWQNDEHKRIEAEKQRKKDVIARRGMKRAEAAPSR